MPLFSEPVDFAQREPELPGLMAGTRDVNWERAEADSPSGDPVEPTTDLDEPTSNLCDPSTAYANEPPVYYYSSLSELKTLRSHLSTQWECDLCSQLDNLVASLEESDPKDGQEDEIDKQPLTKWPPVPPLPPALAPDQLTSLLSNSDAVAGGDVDVTNKLPTMEKAFVLELSDSVLVHNQDGLVETFPLTPEDYSSQLQETRPPLVFFTPLPANAKPASSLRWRSWTNTLGRGLLLPNPTHVAGLPSLINIALNRLQQHDEREKRRVLGNKFSLTEVTLDAWRWLDNEEAALMLRRAKGDAEEEEPDGEDQGVVIRRRVVAVGPARWLHTLKMTLCYMEAQVVYIGVLYLASYGVYFHASSVGLFLKLPAGVLCPVWRVVRKDWLSAVLKATSVYELADLLSRLEAAIRPVAFQRTWTSSIGKLSSRTLRFSSSVFNHNLVFGLFLQVPCNSIGSPRHNARKKNVCVHWNAPRQLGPTTTSQTPWFAPRPPPSSVTPSGRPAGRSIADWVAMVGSGSV